MSEDFKVEVSEGWKALPPESSRFTQNDNGKSYLGVADFAADLVDKKGEKISAGLPYLLDPTKLYFIRTVGSTCNFGIVTEFVGEPGIPGDRVSIVFDERNIAREFRATPFTHIQFDSSNIAEQFAEETEALQPYPYTKIQFDSSNIAAQFN